MDGRQCSTGFTLYKEHLKTYTPEYQESITTVPAATIRQVAKELGEAACIGQTTEIDGVTLLIALLPSTRFPASRAISTLSIAAGPCSA